MKVICIDDSKKPSKISSDEWIQEGVVYTVVEVVRLKEVNLSQKSFPYEYYDATRFIPIEGLVEHSKVEEEVELDLV